jgi:hypothetical protein
MHVRGDDVTLYGAAVEHTLGDLLLWEGERGATYFYQSELPYDVTQANFGDKGYVGYRVAPGVTSHKGFGIGVYHFFRDNAVTVQTAIVAPAALESSFVSPLTVYLNGKGSVQHVINDKGNVTTGPATSTAYWCGGSGPAPSPSPPSPSPPGPTPGPSPKPPGPSPPSPKPPSPSPPSPKPPSPTPGGGCAACTADECAAEKCAAGAPFVCTRGGAMGGCSADATLWPKSPACDACCNAGGCPHVLGARVIM